MKIDKKKWYKIVGVYNWILIIIQFTLFIIYFATGKEYFIIAIFTLLVAFISIPTLYIEYKFKKSIELEEKICQKTI